MTQIQVNMSSNSEVFHLPDSVHWERATLERCNLVYTNGADMGAQYVIHIDQMDQPLLVCASGATANRIGSFLVGAEPFNVHESLTIRNTNPSRALQQLNVKIYTLAGALATITGPFCFALKIKEHQV
jgi:hypothetical protein